MPFYDVLGPISALVANAVARDKALVPMLDLAQDCFQIVSDGFRAFASD